jgi:hypothetical protein
MNQRPIDLGTALRVALRVHLQPAAEAWQGFVACCVGMDIDPEEVVRSSRPQRPRPGESILDNAAALRALDRPTADPSEVRAWETTFLEIWRHSTESGGT